MNKRVHQIAKERGLASKDLLERLRAAGIDVKAASSNVDEDVALKVLGNGTAASPPGVDGKGADTPPPPPASPPPSRAAAADQPAAQAPAAPSQASRPRTDHKQ